MVTTKLDCLVHISSLKTIVWQCQVIIRILSKLKTMLIYVNKNSIEYYFSGNQFVIS